MSHQISATYLTTGETIKPSPRPNRIAAIKICHTSLACCIMNQPIASKQLINIWHRFGPSGSLKNLLMSHWNEFKKNCNFKLTCKKSRQNCSNRCTYETNAACKLNVYAFLLQNRINYKLIMNFKKNIEWKTFT